MPRKHDENTEAYVDDFLQSVGFKSAAEGDASGPKSKSVDENEANPTAGVKTTQGSAGKEMTDAAQESGSTVEKVDNSSSTNNVDAKDNEAPKKLEPDDTIESKSDVLTTIKKLEITNEQKAARAGKLMQAFAKVQQKEAAEKQEFSKLAEEEKAALALLQEMHVRAEKHASEAYNSYMYGQIQRVIDTQAIMEKAAAEGEELSLDEVNAFLDKCAEEDPASVLPDGVDPAEMGMAPEVPVDDAAVAEEAAAAEMDDGEMGAAGMDEAEVEQALNEAVGTLQQMGVPEEDIQEAIGTALEMVQSGVDPAELAEAVQEVVQEDGLMEGEPGAEMGDAAAEAGSDMTEEVPAEEEVKAASDKTAAARRSRIDALKQMLRENF